MKNNKKRQYIPKNNLSLAYFRGEINIDTERYRPKPNVSDKKLKKLVPKKVYK